MTFLIASFIAVFAFSTVEATPTHAQEPLPYEILEVEDTSIKAMGGRSLSDFTPQELERLPTNHRLSVRVVVPDSIRREEVAPTVNAVIDRLTSERPEVDEIGILLYSDSAVADGAYDVARATWSTGGDLGGITPRIAEENDRTGYATSIETRDNLEAYLKQRGKAETRAGLSEQKRREIFQALVRAEDRALRDAERRYPTNTNCVSVREAQRNMDRNIAVEDSLRSVYERQVRQEYDITKSVADSISVEGIAENWPMPEMPLPGC